MAKLRVDEDTMDIEQRKTRVATLSVASNAMLVVLKLVVGLLIGSVGVISEAIHSGVDLVAAAIALFAVRTSRLPADEGHPFGHGKAENLSGTVEAALIAVAAVWIIIEAIHKLRHPSPLEGIGWGVAIMLLSSIANWIVSTSLFAVARESDSVALEADAWHLRTDVYTSAGVMLGLAAVLAGRRWLPGVNLAWVDPVAGLAVAVLIFHAAWELTVQAGRDLMDASLPPAEREWLAAYLHALGPEVRSIHAVRTRKSGSMRHVQLHLVVDGTMTVAASHAITERIETEVEARYANTKVLIHVEPCDAGCPPACLLGCRVDDTMRADLQSGAKT